MRNSRKGNSAYKISHHYDDVIMTMLASQITSLPVVCSIVYSDVNQRKHQSSASLAFVREIHRGPVNFPHKWPVTRKMFPFDDVIMMSFKVSLHIETSNGSWRRGIKGKCPAQFMSQCYGIFHRTVDINWICIWKPLFAHNYGKIASSFVILGPHTLMIRYT